MSERLAELLRDAADEPEPLRMEDIEQGVRQRRRSRTALAAAVVAVGVAAVVLPLTVIPRSAHPVSLTATPTPTTTQTEPRDSVVSYRQVSVTIPPGWTTGPPPVCGLPIEHFVAIGPAPPAWPCPMPAPQIEDRAKVAPGISVVFEDAQNAATSSPAVSPRWAGQPAGTRRTTTAVRLSDGTVKAVTDITVDLPLLDASVAVQAATPAAAAALLERVTAHPAGSVGTPAVASSLRVSTVATSEPARQRDATTSDAPRIAAVLAALRTAPLLPVSTPICDADAAQPVALLTVPGVRTVQVRLGGCDEVVVGNGTLARATPQLRSALAAIVGRAALD